MLSAHQRLALTRRFPGLEIETTVDDDFRVFLALGDSSIFVFRSVVGRWMVSRPYRRSSMLPPPLSEVEVYDLYDALRDMMHGDPPA